MSDPGQPVGAAQPKQVDSPDYHHRNHTAAQTCGWTANALRGVANRTVAPDVLSA